VRAKLAMAAALAIAPSLAWAAGFGLPPDASAEGWRIDRLFASTHVLIAVVAVIAFGGLALAVLLFRARSVPHYTHGTTWRAMALPLAAAAFVLVVIDGNLMCTATRDLQVLGDARGRAEDPDAVRIQLTARQWSWEARYEGGDGAFGTDRDVVVLDHLRVPIGRPVVVQLASVDVVHALNLPNFRVKMQAIPGRINMVWFQAKKLGRFEIACAQHCGPFHYKMRGLLEVLSEEDFEAWLAAESADAARVRRERARADAEEPAPRARWPVWREPPLTGAWSWEAGLRGEGAPDKREDEPHDHHHDDHHHHHGGEEAR
jgi:cytochrome c oxidase subunit II